MMKEMWMRMRFMMVVIRQGNETAAADAAVQKAAESFEEHSNACCGKGVSDIQA